MKLSPIIMTFLIIPHILFAENYWQRYADSLIKEQKQAKEQPYIAPFVIEYLNTRIAMAQDLSRSFDSTLQNNNEHQAHITNCCKQILSLCFDKTLIDITKEQVTKELQRADISNNDAIIIHTELVLSTIFRQFDTIFTNNSTQQYDIKQIIQQCQPPFDDLSQSTLFQELSAHANFIIQQQHLITSIASLCNATQYDDEQIRQNPEHAKALLAQLENALINVPEKTATYQQTDGIPYQITIPQQLDCARAIYEIQNKRDAIVTEKDATKIGDIESIARSYLTPIENQIAEQKKLLAIMKSTDGVAIENEEAFNNVVHRFETQSKLLRDYANATTLYCQLALLQAPHINYSGRCQHIVHYATHIQKLVQSLGDSSKEIIPEVKQLFEVLKAFLYTDAPKENNDERATTLQTLHTIKENIYTIASTRKDDAPNPALCNLEIAMNIETLEKGIKLFNTQTYAKQALMRYASTIQKAFELVQTGFSDTTIQQIIEIQSAIPVVDNFDVQQIINEYTSQQYVLRKLRADSASLMHRIESYKKKGIRINDYEKAKEIVETIKSMQPLYTVDVGKYKMNQNNILIIDRQCVALLKRMMKNNKLVSNI
ncbi:MAG: hypothetical protein QHH74_04240 [Spirochaetota bacterium]|nr:hypothetical protein [Spirochaetota bacterium]